MSVVYSLTPLTGSRKNENRRTVVMTFEVKQRSLIVGILSFIASLPVTGIIALFIGIYSLVVPFIMVGAGLWLWDSRQRRGLKLLNYQAMLDSRKARNGVLYSAGQPVPHARAVMHQSQIVPVEKEAGTVAPSVLASSNTQVEASAARRRALSVED